MTDTTEKGGDPEMKGWLLKWTNYIKGYQRRWFVLSNGVLSYYRNQSEINHTCRGTISLHGALIHTVDSCTFVISNGGTQTFHIKAANEVERQSWVTALELAKARAIRAMESEEEEVEETMQVVPSQEINTVVRDLGERLENMRTCYDLIIKHGVALQRALTELEANEEELDLAVRQKIVNERATLFRITANAMINACNDYLRTAETQGHKWSKALQHEREQKQRLEEIVEQLAKQHTQLEQAARVQVMRKEQVDGTTSFISADYPGTPVGGIVTRSNLGLVTSDDENEFFDAIDSNYCFGDDSVHPTVHYGAFSMRLPPAMTLRRSDRRSDALKSGQASTSSSSENEELKRESVCVRSGSNDMDTNDYAPSFRHESEQSRALVLADVAGSLVAMPKKEPIQSNKPVKKRRTRVPDKPNYPLNLWSIMKNCIGKELSKIPMPVNFNEPLSMLQRLTEDYEYSELLDYAATQCGGACVEDECEQLAYVAAFTISSYSTTASRTGKPFNPLLGETFECDRTDDLGWRCIAEQVSHHPPMAAIHCEGSDWSCSQEFTMTSKFRGKYLQVIPLGNAYVHFHKTGHKYTWRKVTTTVNNIIVGKLWVDQHGEMEITGMDAAAGLKCVLKYIPYSYFSKEQQRRVKGVVKDRNNDVKWVLHGTWDEKIEIAPVLSTSGTPDSPVYKTGAYKTVWQRRMPPPDSDKYYNFTVLACQLNEPEEGVAPTDSRLRPDQRLMEQGHWTESNQEKVRLEEKQRLKRRQRETEAEAAANTGHPYPPYDPIWFERVKQEGSDNVMHVYKGTYWEHKRVQDWSMCPDLF